MIAGWLRREGSTRALGLVRVGTGLMLWARFAREMMPMRDLHPDRVALSMAFYVFSTGMVLGVATPVSMAGMAAVMATMVIGYGAVIEDWTHHHVTLHMLVVFWLALTPCGRSFSVDRWLAVRSAEARGAPLPPERGPLWAAVLLPIQVCTVYAWSVVDKLGNHFLNGTQLEQLAMMYVFGAQPPEGPVIAWVYPALAWAVVALEIALPVGLWHARARLPLMALGVVMHALFYVLLPVKTFTAQMVLLYLTFFDPDDVHRAIDRWLGHGSPR